MIIICLMIIFLSGFLLGYVIAKRTYKPPFVDYVYNPHDDDYVKTFFCERCDKRLKYCPKCGEIVSPSSFMGKIDFTTYIYFYDHGIVRMNKTTKECEHFHNGEFVEYRPLFIKDRLPDTYDDLSEFSGYSPREVELFYEELSRGKTIK